MGDMIQTLTAIWPFILMALIFYFMLYKPQKKEQAKRAALLDSLKKGDRVMTVGGLYGVIAAISDNKVALKIAENVEVEFAKSAINQKVDKDGTPILPEKK